MNRYRVALEGETLRMKVDCNVAQADPASAAYDYAEMKLAVVNALGQSLPSAFTIVVLDVDTTESTRWRVPVVMVPSLRPAERLEGERPVPELTQDLPFVPDDGT